MRDVFEWICAITVLILCAVVIGFGSTKAMLAIIIPVYVIWLLEVTRPRRLNRSVIAAALILVGNVAWADFLPWMEGIKDAQGVACCGDQNCVPADVLATNPIQGRVIVDGVGLQLDPGQVHRVPVGVEQSRGWWCWRGDILKCSPPELERSPHCARCVFYNVRAGEE